MRHAHLRWAVASLVLTTSVQAQQPDADSVPLTRRLLVAGSVSYQRVVLTNGPSNTIGGSALARVFLNDALQIGVAPNVQLFREPFNNNGGNGWGGAVANYGVDVP